MSLMFELRSCWLSLFIDLFLGSQSSPDGPDGAKVSLAIQTTKGVLNHLLPTANLPATLVSRRFR
jgi:hypothetical protein